MSNPALNPRSSSETAANDQGAFTPGWGSPAQEVPPNLFGQPGSTPPGGAAPGAATGPYASGPGAYPPVPTQPGTTPPGTTLPPGRPVDHGDTMRMSGTMSASAILLGILLVGAWFGWQAVTVTVRSIAPDGSKSYAIDMPPWIFLAMIVGFGLAILTIFKPRLARITAPFYAVAEGVFLGAISAAYNAQWDGIVLQAVSLTMGVFVMMLILYATGTIKVTNRLRTGIIAAMGAVCLVYLVTIVASLFGTTVPIVNDASALGIGFSLLVVGVASMNLLLNFDFIQQAVDNRAPRYMEWFAAFGLMLALVWLYLEILRLLAKLRSR